MNFFVFLVYNKSCNSTELYDIKLSFLWRGTKQWLNVFGYDDEGYAENVFSGDNNTGTVAIEASLEADVIDAAEGCPTEAIKVQDSPFN